MKKLLATALLAALPFTAAAEEEVTERTIDQTCAEVGEMAYQVMRARQNGIAMSELMKIMEDSPVGRAMVLDAYAESRYNSQDYRDRQAEDFRATSTLQCYRSLGG